MIPIVIKKRTLIAVIVIIAILAAVILGVSLGTGSAEVGAKNRKVPVYSVQTSEKKVALTFDAAWGADQTVKIMDAVEKYGFKCTFFLTGFWIDENPELVKEIASRGHLIGNHSESHKHLNEVADLNAEIDAVNTEINTLTGASPKYFRAPFGEYDNNMMSTLESKGMQGVQWSIDSLDWKGLSAAEIAERVVNDLEPGDIVLMHNASDHIVEALPLILLSIQNKGLTAVRLDEMLYSENYTVNSQGIQIQNQ